MTIYMISYDLNKAGQDYSSLIKAIESYPGYLNLLKSQWLIGSDKSVNEIYQHLSKYIDKNDHIFINRLIQPYQGYLSKRSCDWLEDAKRLGHL